MTLCKKMINLLLLVLGIQISLQTNYFPIIEALNITNPYYVMDTFDFKSKDLIKHHFNKSDFAMLCHSIKDIPIKNKEDIQSIIQFTKNVEGIKTKVILYQVRFYHHFFTRKMTYMKLLSFKTLRSTKLL